MADDEPEFQTAAELRESVAQPEFDIPARPDRRYPAGGGLEYEGGVVFALTPRAERTEEDLTALVKAVLGGDTYTYGDWFDLPMPLYLVHDKETDDTFRVGVREGTVELHVLPGTDQEGLRTFYDRLTATTEGGWRVECHVLDDSGSGL